MWLLYAQFEIRQKNLPFARRALVSKESRCINKFYEKEIKVLVFISFTVPVSNRNMLLNTDMLEHTCSVKEDWVRMRKLLYFKIRKFIPNSYQIFPHAGKICF